VFLLDILSHRMSDIAIYRQLSDKNQGKSRWIRMESGRNPAAARGAIWPLYFRSIRLTPPS
jgi:hypothetical protein